MVINYQDRCLQVSYIQIFLKDYFGLTIEKQKSARATQDNEYQLTSNSPIKVTGYYNLQTYSSLALWMAYNYPKEGFPQVWYLSESNQWEYKDFTEDYPSDDYTTEEFRTYISQVISTNMDNFIVNHDIIRIPERVLSYVFNEVVTSHSTPEEVVRVKQLVLGTPIGRKLALEYHDDFEKIISRIQSDFIALYTINGEVSLPEQYKEFKVTGYVDPWTELIIKGGSEPDDD